MKGVPNPCKGVCDSTKTETKICTGCYRHTDEVGMWSSATDEQKDSIIKAAKARQREHKLERIGIRL